MSAENEQHNKLKEKIKKFETENLNTHIPDSQKQPSAILTKIAIEMIATMFTSFLLGYYVDKFFNTKPIFLLICLFIGLITAIYNIYRFYINIGKED